ncbi:MAG: hypothetical protein ABEK36_02205 [Candidatus Aenigmatarchaeota archaeon]
MAFFKEVDTKEERDKEVARLKQNGYESLNNYTIERVVYSTYKEHNDRKKSNKLNQFVCIRANKDSEEKLDTLSSWMDFMTSIS